MSVPLPDFCVINRSLCTVPSMPIMRNRPRPSAAASLSDGLLRSLSAWLDRCTVKELICIPQWYCAECCGRIMDVEIFLLSRNAGGVMFSAILVFWQHTNSGIYEAAVWTLTVPQGLVKQDCCWPAAEKKGKGHDCKIHFWKLRTSFLVQSKCVPFLVQLLKAEVIPPKL